MPYPYAHIVLLAEVSYRCMIWHPQDGLNPLLAFVSLCNALLEVLVIQITFLFSSKFTIHSLNYN
jgi:hypothetical protein